MFYYYCCHLLLFMLKILNRINSTTFRACYFSARSWHSDNLHKFFTNKYHKKICPNCEKPNSLPTINCTACNSLLLDSSIRLIKNDLLQEAGLARDKSNLIELHRSFELLIVKNPHPIGLIHLIVTPKSTMYDIKQLKKRDLQLLQLMYEKGLESLQKCISDLPEAMHTEARKMAIWGFNYPSEYNQLALHIVIPPISNFKMFEHPLFYPFDKVVSDLQNVGRVQSFSRVSKFKPNSVNKEPTTNTTLTLQTLMENDKICRSILGDWTIKRETKNLHLFKTT